MRRARIWLPAALWLGGAAFWPAIAAADPRSDYMLHCQGCHGPDGGGARGAVPSFRGTVAKFLAVPGGREYLVRVPGTAQSELSDARTAVLLNWIVREFSPAEIPAGAAPYGESEVARLRRPPLTDVEGERRRLLEAIAAREISLSREAGVK